MGKALNLAGTRVGVPGFFLVGGYQGSPLRGQPFAVGFIPVGEWENSLRGQPFAPGFVAVENWTTRYAANPSLWAVSPLEMGQLATRRTLRFGLYPRWGMGELAARSTLRSGLYRCWKWDSSLRGELFASGCIAVGVWEDFAMRRTLRFGLYPRWGMGELRYAASSSLRAVSPLGNGRTLLHGQPSLRAVSPLGNGRTSLRGELFALGFIAVRECTRRNLLSHLRRKKLLLSFAEN
jgi:hypothetical protein